MGALQWDRLWVGAAEFTLSGWPHVSQQEEAGKASDPGTECREVSKGVSWMGLEIHGSANERTRTKETGTQGAHGESEDCSDGRVVVHVWNRRRGKAGSFA